MSESDTQELKIMSVNNSAFKSLYDVVVHILDKEHYLSRDGVWVVGKQDTFNPVNVGFNLDSGINHMIVKGAYFSLYANNFTIHTNDYKKNDATALMPHKVSVSGYIDDADTSPHPATEQFDMPNTDDIVNLVVDAAKPDGDGGDGNGNGRAGGNGGDGGGEITTQSQELRNVLVTPT